MSKKISSIKQIRTQSKLGFKTEHKWIGKLNILQSHRRIYSNISPLPIMKISKITSRKTFIDKCLVPIKTSRNLNYLKLTEKKVNHQQLDLIQALYSPIGSKTNTFEYGLNIDKFHLDDTIVDIIKIL